MRRISLQEPRRADGLEQVAVHESILPQHTFAGVAGNSVGEDGSGGDKGVELTALSARIRRLGKIREQRCVELSAGKAVIELSRIHANESSGETPVDEFTGEIAGIASPDWKHRLESAA